MTTSETARLFVAITLPDPVRDGLVALQRELGTALETTRLRRVAAENLHLTLRFLGDVPRARIETLCDDLRAGAATRGAFTLTMTGTGCFPASGPPRAVWAGIRDPDRDLTPLAAAVRVATADVAATRNESRFAAHVTLARCRRMTRAERRALAAFVQATNERVIAAFDVSDIALVESRLTHAGSAYSVLERFDLAGHRNTDAGI